MWYITIPDVSLFHFCNLPGGWDSRRGAPRIFSEKSNKGTKILFCGRVSKFNLCQKRAPGCSCCTLSTFRGLEDTGCGRFVKENPLRQSYILTPSPLPTYPLPPPKKKKLRAFPSLYMAVHPPHSPGDLGRLQGRSQLSCIRIKQNNFRRSLTHLKPILFNSPWLQMSIQCPI